MDAKSAINQVLEETTEEVKAVVAGVLRIENNYIHMALPRGIHDDIQDLIERVVK
ncbi:hypothetical protein HMPREF0591_2078 [Mycobacterium parascrofulaceum ATCC BAA-614]|uniref:Uncharacterized protein n=1 Tax=Mycobacterium parascrofulaceum ATCC BAA-614 TaxID=525368 RepID=D5P7D4_9MYCO|nr:hypothetical protein HMPREF0591_2078 [Mycobacterium parascrofulaceum ATCC BAA-614]